MPLPITARRIRLSPDYAHARSDHDATYFLGSDNEIAVRDYDEALRLDSKPQRTYTNRAAAYNKLDQ